jgi:hypothetical protein
MTDDEAQAAIRDGLTPYHVEQTYRDAGYRAIKDVTDEPERIKALAIRWGVTKRSAEKGEKK